MRWRISRLNGRWALAALSIAVGGCGPFSAGGPAVTVAPDSYRFAPASLSIDAGKTYFLTLRNDDSVAHTLSVGLQTVRAEPGTWAVLRVRLEAGPHPLVCTESGHADRGMRGVIDAR